MGRIVSLVYTRQRVSYLLHLVITINGRSNRLFQHATVEKCSPFNDCYLDIVSEDGIPKPSSNKCLVATHVQRQSPPSIADDVLVSIN